MALRWAAMNTGEKVAVIATPLGAAILIVCGVTRTMNIAIVLPTVLVVGSANAYLYWRSMRGVPESQRDVPRAVD